MARLLVTLALLGAAQARLSAPQTSLSLEQAAPPPENKTKADAAPAPASAAKQALLVAPAANEPTDKTAKDAGHSQPAATATVKRAGPEPMFTEETMPAVSPTLLCVMMLAIQYFLVYTCLAVVRTANEFTSGVFLGIQRLLESACTTVTYAPMLSVLFLGARMRALQLTQGQTEKYQLPQPWVQMAMFVTCCAVAAQLMIVLVIPICTGGMSGNTDEHGDIDMDKVHFGGTMYFWLCSARHILIIVLFSSVAVVVVGIFMMEGPKEVWGDSTPPVSPAVLNTILLATVFLVVYTMVAMSKMSVELNGHTPFQTKLGGLLTLARYTVNLAPMLAILFIGARMRALQIDPKRGNPQYWAQWCFYACTISLILQTMLIIIMPFCVKCECKLGASEGDVVFEMDNKWVGIVFTVIRYIALLALYAGFTGVIASIFLISHPTDPSLTPPISPAMVCVLALTVQYFTIYLVLFISVTVQQLMGWNFMHMIIAILEGAVKTVMFAPMLSILFVGTRMRALQLTQSKDGTIPHSAGPQPWVQDAMFVATWSVLVQLVMVILVPLLPGGTTSEMMDDAGKVKPAEGAHRFVIMAVETFRYMSMLAMYGGIVTIMVGIIVMKPETLPPYSHDKTLVPQPPMPPTQTETAAMAE